MFRFRSQKENERQEKLLLSVLPSFVAQQMIRNSFNNKPFFYENLIKQKLNVERLKNNDKVFYKKSTVN